MANSISHSASLTSIARCGECDAVVAIAELKKGQHAECPRCHHTLQSKDRWSLRRCGLIAFSILILMPFALTYPLLSVDLIGLKVDASIWGGVWKMATEGYPYTAFMVFLTAVFAPISFALLVILLRIVQIIKRTPRNLLIAIDYIKPWVMFDVYLVALGVSAFKVRDYASLHFDIYLIAFITVAILITLLFIKINPRELWADFYPQHMRLSQISNENRPHFCSSCDYTFEHPLLDEKQCPICPRCHSELDKSAAISLQQTWAPLIAGIIMLFPANLYPISYTFMNNIPSGDTLISGVISFINMGSYFVAFIVFTASIFVPISKVLIMLYLLGSIHFNWRHSIKWQMRLFHIIHFVGRWSMLDLFVLALMMSLVTRGQIISFSVGPAAFYFGASVFLTMIATTNFDSRLLWKIYEKQESH
ncbi:paraquat-inducible protein A [Bisgaard Taxon 10/6]|uniref:paraquat-inducible protein A n=1 Tax=Exercitatus varius TaxID=67857 RepID=UPI00294B16F3|nr:paraquat-inducible protein A [Exercitatus varius]MDG2956911.1 paraquat-inducible protein A [Exercitatus varius]MDG2963303.1 paraquat-inducible protein A [Exercitatus varius]MDG2965044.1 paraquat-inducible protein A [Exercitatus varius]